MIRKLWMMVLSLLIAGVIASPASATPREIIMTVHQPVELAGHVLSPGRYMLTAVDPGATILRVAPVEGKQSWFIVTSHTLWQPQADEKVTFDVAKSETGLPRVVAIHFPEQQEAARILYPSPNSRTTREAGLSAPASGARG